MWCRWNERNFHFQWLEGIKLIIFSLKKLCRTDSFGLYSFLLMRTSMLDLLIPIFFNLLPFAFLSALILLVNKTENWKENPIGSRISCWISVWPKDLIYAFKRTGDDKNDREPLHPLFCLIAKGDFRIFIEGWGRTELSSQIIMAHSETFKQKWKIAPGHFSRIATTRDRKYIEGLFFQSREGSIFATADQECKFVRENYKIF